MSGWYGHWLFWCLGSFCTCFVGLKWSAPSYIEQVWNLDALSGVIVYGLPLEELLFGFTFGLVWTGIYEHFTWKRSVSDSVAAT